MKSLIYIYIYICIYIFVGSGINLIYIELSNLILCKLNILKNSKRISSDVWAQINLMFNKNLIFCINLI